MIAQINACIQDYVRIKCFTYNTFSMRKLFIPKGMNTGFFTCAKIRHTVHKQTYSYLWEGENKLLSLVLKLHRKAGNVAQCKNICVEY